MWFQKNKRKLIAVVCIITLLAAAFYFGGNAPDSRGWSEGAPSVPTESAVADSPEPKDSLGQAQAITPSAAEEMPQIGSEQKDGGDPASKPVVSPAHAPATNPSPEPAPEFAPQVQVATCRVSISCETILSNMELCDPDKAELVPENGWILSPLTVAFTEGESVFDILQRVCRDNGIHLEFEDTPAYGSVYIEGIYNLYEFDAGELSGWMYKVNGWFPNYGCSLYETKDGDEICWVYTCEQGADVGGGLS